MSKSTNRKYIQLYHDSLSVLDKLSNEQAGILIKSIYKYSLDGEYPVLEFALDIAINPFINQINRESERQSENAEIYRENGKKGGRPKKNQNNQSGFLETKDNQNNQTKPITTTITTTNTITKDNNKKGKVTKVTNASSDAMLVVEYFNQINSTTNTGAKPVLDGINRILKDYSIDDIKLVIDFMADSWYSENGQNTLSVLAKHTKFYEKLEKAQAWGNKKSKSGVIFRITKDSRVAFWCRIDNDWQYPNGYTPEQALKAAHEKGWHLKSDDREVI